MSCSTDGCSRPLYADGFCKPHRDRALYRGELTETPRPRPERFGPIPMVEIRSCSVPSCPLEVHCRELCKAHYLRTRRGSADLLSPVRPYRLGETCSVDGCSGRYYARSLCKIHYERDRLKARSAA